MTSDPAPRISKPLRAAILVAALGYFVDVYDIALFSIVRKESLKELGLSDADILSQGIYLLDLQMAGMLIGGILWGVLGDKWGRLEVLFGSILVYSLANLGNAFVTDVPTYALLRLVAGIGLAGEIGAGITLVSEIMPKERRGLGTSIVATVGVSGAVAAAIIGHVVHWRTAYIIGGVGGLLLLLLRFGARESGMFDAVKHDPSVRRGDLRLLFDRSRAMRYLACVMTGVPMFFFVGLVVTLSPEIGKALNLTEEVNAADAVLFYSIGITLGDLGSGLVSQALKSRRRAIGLFLAGAAIVTAAILLGEGRSATYYYALLAPGGFFIGYWCVLVTTAAEQFGTNLRSTVAATVPNFVRGMTIPITAGFMALRPHLGAVGAVQAVGIVCFALAAIGLYFLRETFSSDLDYVEVDGGRK